MVKEIVEELVESIDSVLGERSRSVEVARAIIRDFGGMQIYWPLPGNAFREEDDADIYDMFDGANAREICRRYKITTNTLYEIIRRETESRRSS